MMNDPDLYIATGDWREWDANCRIICTFETMWSKGTFPAKNVISSHEFPVKNVRMMIETHPGTDNPVAILK